METSEATDKQNQAPAPIGSLSLVVQANPSSRSGASTLSQTFPNVDLARATSPRYGEHQSWACVSGYTPTARSMQGLPSIRTERSSGMACEVLGQQGKKLRSYSVLSHYKLPALPNLFPSRSHFARVFRKLLLIIAFLCTLPLLVFPSIPFPEPLCRAANF